MRSATGRLALDTEPLPLSAPRESGQVKRVPGGGVRTPSLPAALLPLVAGGEKKSVQYSISQFEQLFR